jgi:hypothetical protein
LLGAMEYAHGGGGGGGGGAGAACVTVNSWPAIVIVPLRAAPAFAATLYPTEPFPVPVAPAVTVSHGALLTAVQAHPAPDVTVTVPAYAFASTFWLGGAIEYAQGGGGGGGGAGASCVTVNV